MTRIWISVDVEGDISEYMQGSFRGVEEGLPRLLAVLKRLQVPCDFFVVSEVAERYPDVVRRLASNGQALGSHGEHHEILCTKDAREQEQSLRKSMATLVEATGSQIRYFRAPNFSANGATVRALEAVGIRYDSSVLPGRFKKKWRLRTVYDHRGAPRAPYRAARYDIDRADGSNIWELPVTENPHQPGTPIGLGFLNSHSFEETSLAVAGAGGAYVSFLIHPWELVDLPVRERRLPQWLGRACRSDVSPLEKFLAAAKQRWGFTKASEITATLGDA